MKKEKRKQKFHKEGYRANWGGNTDTKGGQLMDAIKRFRNQKPVKNGTSKNKI